MSEDYSAKIWKVIIIILVVAFGVRYFLLTDSGVYKGQGFEMKFPEGWTEWEIPEELKQQRGEEMDDKIQTVTFISPENEFNYDRDASLSVISYKLDQAAWLEDEFPRIIGAIKKQGNHIIKDGQVEIDGEETRWVFYHDKKNKILNLEFYIVTTGNMFYKIHYAADEKKFKEHRPAFEAAKETFKITGFRL